jgi:acid phosphatase type 7
VYVLASMALAVVLVYLATALVAVPVYGQRAASVTLVGAGDIASCNHTADSATARLLGRIGGTVYTLGDNVYPNGTSAQFRECYKPTWGKYKKRTKPIPGNHDYNTAGASGYFEYFGARAGRSARGYYSYRRGSWHIVALNSNCAKIGGCTRRSAQGRWLGRDLASHPSRCTLAYFHHPLYASGTGTPTPQVKPLWNILYSRGADIILSGHAHRYERYRPITPEGKIDTTNGIRQFVVGTGGEPGGSEIHLGQAPGLQVVKIGTPGVLKLNLAAGSYSWKFVPIAGKSFTDSGSDSCH